MRAQLNRNVSLCGVDYKVGAHDLPSDAAEGWFFNALVKSGEIVVLDVVAKSVQDAAITNVLFVEQESPKEEDLIDDVESQIEEPKRRGRPAKQDTFNVEVE